MSRNYLPRAPRSDRAPYIEGEDPGARHQRRLDIARDDQPRLHSQLGDLLDGLALHNGGRHWKLRAGGKLFEWWPESGRVVIDQRWNRARKAHDVDQLARIVRKVCR